MYDNQEHNPKLLPCSHTVCKTCLGRIVEAQARDTGTFRCPICRETITIPRGGIPAFPPSFIVNQLLDLMQRQRRDIIPKCSNHSNQELLFCETCDQVFCTQCTDGSHNGRSSEHTVIPFSIAIKRMSEILLYKASLCIRNLNTACDNVNDEITKLDSSVEHALDAVNCSFQELISVVEKRRHEVLNMVKKTRDEKMKVLKEQLDIIQAEKVKVENECHGLQYQVEVRNITKKISDLNEKLDTTTTLTEPRENAFMVYEYKHNTALNDLKNVLENFGHVRISKTFPALCKANLDKSVTHLTTRISIKTVDYHGAPRNSGGDPITVELKNERNIKQENKIKDKGDGSYEISFIPQAAGRHRLMINIFGRPIRDSPFYIDVTEHNNPVMKFGSRGSGNQNFTQPVGITMDSQEMIYALDTGNSRIKVISKDGKFVKHIGQVGLENHSGTGITKTPNDNLVVVNWRSKHVTEMDRDGEVVKKFTSPEFIEPIDVSVNSHGEIIVADNGAGRLFVFDANGRMINKIGSKGDKAGQFKLISSVTTGKHDEVIVADSRLQVFSRQGKYLQEIQSASSIKGQYGGVTVDRFGNILASRTEKGKYLVQVFSPSRKFLFNIDSLDDKLKRPSGLVTSGDHHVVVVDLGNDCIKKYRYK